MTKTSGATVLTRHVVATARPVPVIKVVVPAVPRRRLLSWTLALSTLALASASVVMLASAPSALPFALVAAALALTARGLLTIVRGDAAPAAATTAATAVSHAEAHSRPASGFANAGLVIALVTLFPLLAFALLWTSLMVWLGITWLLYTLGLM